MVSYDVIIIGGGIGGLVCGCYLVKSGLKVLIIEKNDHIGGYCSSFEINNFVFNSYIRGFVGCSPGALFYKVLVDLNIQNKINIIRPEVYDIIKYKNYCFYLYNDVKQTVEEIKKAFPREAKNIDKFFELILNASSLHFYKYRYFTFQKLIDEFFIDNDVKFLMTALRIDSGRHCYQTSAIADTMLIRGNILDGGYFVKGGMGNLSNEFAKYFQMNGGKIILNQCVKTLNSKLGLASSITTSDGVEIKTKFVVSNVDATYTYNVLLSKFNIEENILKQINSMTPSISLFVVYLALSKSLKPYLKKRCSAIWSFLKSIGDGIVITLPSVVDSDMAPLNCESVTMYYGMPFNNKDYWKKNKERIAQLLLNRFFHVFPDFRNDILFYKSVTPIDLYEETYNKNGASRGWEVSLDQYNNLFPTQTTPVSNVFLAGHWTKSLAGNGGITFAAQSGKKTAKLILQKF